MMVCGKGSKGLLWVLSARRVCLSYFGKRVDEKQGAIVDGLAYSLMSVNLL